MKLLHVSDLHIGKRMNGLSLVEDQRYILDSIVSLAKDEHVDALLLAGDVYDKASPSAEAVTVFDSFLMKLAEARVAVLAIPGNHDSAERIAYAQGLLSAQRVYFPSVYEGEVSQVVLEDGYGPVTFWLLPFLKPSDVRRYFPDEEIADDYSAAIGAVLRSCEVDRSQRNVILSHQLVTSAGAGPDRADDEIKLGGIDNVDVSLYADFDYVALGHVHRPQRVGRDTVRYSGSPLKYSFSEARYEKSVTVVELGPKASGEVGSCVEFKLEHLPPLHDMREVRTTLQELLDEASGLGPEKQDYLHITLTDEQPQLDAMAKIREQYPNALSLDYDSTAMLEHFEATRKAVDPDEVDTVELFAQFFEDQVGDPLDEGQRDYVRETVNAVLHEHARGCGDGDGVEGGVR